MPLFKHKNRDNATSNTGYNPNTQSDDTTGYSNAPGTTGAGGNLPRRNQDAQNDPAYPPPNTAPGVTGAGGNLPHRDQHGQNDPAYPSSNAPGGYNTNAGRNDQFTGNDQSQQQGYGAGGTTGAALHAMPPQTDAHGNPVHPKTGGGGSRLGKVESAVGNMFGSESLKQKGLEKENESQALKVQAAELGEAERLEQEALARRQRAVAHGAHPDHKYLGSHNPSAAGNVNEHGGETSSGRGGIGGAGGNSRRGY